MNTLGDVIEFYAPLTLKSIIGAGFGQQAHLEKVVLSDSVKQIGGEAFVECGVLNEINLNMVEEIQEAAFAACTSLTEVHLDSVLSVMANAFAECPILTVYLNDNVEEIVDGAFANIQHLYYHGNLPGAPWGAQAWN